MKLVLLSCVLALLVLLVLFIQAVNSRREVDVGLLERRLRPCLDKPNCVCSEYNTSKRYFIEPIVFHGIDSQVAWERLSLVVEAQGGQIRQNQDGYLWATFKSKFWRFTDDLEARLDPKRRVIQIRSASRVGYSDFGVNARRVEALRVEFNAKQSKR